MPGLIRGVARTAVVAGTATAVSNRVSRRQANRWSQQAEQQQEPVYAQPAPPPPEPAAPAGGTDLVQMLTQLGELHDKGVLTDEEFAVQKSKLLA